MGGDVFGYLASGRPWWVSPFPDVVKFASLRGGVWQSARQ